jgi:hypothetical protein
MFARMTPDTPPPAPAPKKPTKPAPWKVPQPVAGTENTPSCNPNFRPVAPPPPSKPAT